MDDELEKEKLKSRQPMLPPLNSFRGLPLELRELIYCSILDDLTAEPQHPYSDLPLGSRFSTYIALNLVSRATSQEVQRLFSKQYAGKVVFYFEDAWSLTELMRDAETKPSLHEVRFVLRTRTDLAPAPHEDALGYMNEGFIIAMDHAVNDARKKKCGITNCILPSMINYSSEYGLDFFYSSPASPTNNYEQPVAGDHSLCGTKEQCIPYKSIRIPEMVDSLSADLAFWQVPEGIRMKQVGILLFRGKVSDIFIEHAYRCGVIRTNRAQLMAFLLWCPWPKVRDLYRGKYPLNNQEWEDFCAGRWSWALEEIDLRMAKFYREEYERKCGASTVDTLTS